MDAVVKREILRIRRNTVSFGEDTVAGERTVSVYLNDVPAACITASPHEWDLLGVGYLVSEGIIPADAPISEVRTEQEQGAVYVYVDGLSETDVTAKIKHRPVTETDVLDNIGNFEPLPVVNPLPADVILQRYHDFQDQSTLFKTTGSVHSAGIGTEKGVEIVEEDIGKLSCVDRVVGKAVHKGLEVAGKMLFTSGRIFLGVVRKAINMKVAFVLSRSAPTDIAVDVAKKMNITLCGFVRGNRMNVYSGVERVVTPKEEDRMDDGMRFNRDRGGRFRNHRRGYE